MKTQIHTVVRSMFSVTMLLGTAMMGSEEGKLLAWDEPLALEPLEERESAVPLQEAPQSTAKWIAKLEAAIQYELSSKNIPSLSIAVVDRERTTFSQGYGFTDVERKHKASASTIYRVGSVSKLFTDIAIMQCVEQGELDLDAPVHRYLSDVPSESPLAQGISLRHLMSHRSGLVRESPIGNYFDPTEPSLVQTVASLHRTKLTYPVHTKTKYSNAGIAVVGAVLQEKKKKPFHELIQETIFQPLGMNQSSFIRTASVDAHLSKAWMWTYDGRRFVAPEFLLGTGPAGNLYSSVEDLTKFMKFLTSATSPAGKEVLPKSTLKKMMDPVLDADGKPQGFGIGFRVSQLDKHRKIGHGGAVYGFSTQLEVLPDEQLGVAICASLDGCNAAMERLALYALRLALADRSGNALPEYAQTGLIEKTRLREMVGNYSNESNERLSIQEFQGKAYLHNGAFRRELRSESRTGETITDDPNGFGTALRWPHPDQLEMEKPGQPLQKWKRLPPQRPSKVRSDWEGLIGEYGWDHNTLYIYEEEGVLMALIEWFYTYPLREINKNEFAFPDEGLYHGERLLFRREGQGQAVSVLAAEVDFPRREIGTQHGVTFKIQPLRPIDELRSEAEKANPPIEQGDFLETDLVELTSLDPTIRLDIRYASTNNFTGAKFYQQARAFMQRPAALQVVQVHRELKAQGLGLLIHDAYRPWRVTKMFWEATPREMRQFVANPANGSRHNRGCAVDLTLCDLRTGEPIEMVSGYDEFSHRAFPMYPGGTSLQRWYRELLREKMESHGFKVYENEWWHFDFDDWKKYRIGNVPFEQLRP